MTINSLIKRVTQIGTIYNFARFIKSSRSSYSIGYFHVEKKKVGTVSTNSRKKVRGMKRYQKGSRKKDYFSVIKRR